MDRARTGECIGARGAGPARQGEIFLVVCGLQVLQAYPLSISPVLYATLYYNYNHNIIISDLPTGLSTIRQVGQDQEKDQDTGHVGSLHRQLNIITASDGKSRRRHHHQKRGRTRC